MLRCFDELLFSELQEGSRGLDGRVQRIFLQEAAVRAIVGPG